jgi:hypothetical protein
MTESKYEKWILLIVVFSVWLIDFGSTMYFINGDWGIYEANPIPAWFFNHGLTLLYFPVIVLFLCFIIILFPKLFKAWDKGEGKYVRLFRWFMSGAIIGMEIGVIASNILDLKGVLF